VSPEAAEVTRRRLDVIRVVAIADAVLLVALLIAALTDREGVVSVLGPVHGLGYLGLLGLCGWGAVEERWGWWFPAIVVVTLGPPGSLIGDRRIRRALSAGAPPP